MLLLALLRAQIQTATDLCLVRSNLNRVELEFGILLLRRSSRPLVSLVQILQKTAILGLAHLSVLNSSLLLGRPLLENDLLGTVKGLVRTRDLWLLDGLLAAMGVGLLTLAQLGRLIRFGLDFVLRLMRLRQWIALDLGDAPILLFPFLEELRCE